MRVRHNLVRVSVVITVLAGMFSLAQADPERNVLLILMDDIGQDTFEAYRTAGDLPRMNTLADTGIRFTSVWSNALCSPTRATILTGRYGFRTGVVQNAGKTPLDESYQTIAEALAAKHTSAVFGKWHLTKIEDRLRCDKGPYAQGFELYKGSYENLQCGQLFEGIFPVGRTCDVFASAEKATDYWNYLRTECSALTDSCGAAVDPSCTSFDPTGTSASLQEHWDQALLNWSDPQLHATEETTADAGEWIFDRSAAGVPWFAYVAYNAAHGPWQPVPPAVPSEPVDGNCEGDSVCMTESHAAMTSHMDDSIGKLIDGIPANALANTIIIVLGDNGTTKNVQSPPDTDPAAQHGHKGTLYEGGINVPMIISTPETRAAGVPVVSDALVNTTDLFATILHLATGTPQSTVEDSVTLGPIIAGTATAVRQHSYAEKKTHATMRNADWKLIVEKDCDLPTGTNCEIEFFDMRVSNPEESSVPFPLTESSPEETLTAFTELCRGIATLNPDLDTNMYAANVAGACCSEAVWTVDDDLDGRPDVCDLCVHCGGGGGTPPGGPILPRF